MIRTGETRRHRRTRRGAHRGRDRGAIAVEMAIAAPLLVLMFFSVLEIGAMLRTRTVVTDASREAARVAAALPRVDGYQNSALAAVSGVVASQKGETIDYVTIYRADPNTGLPSSGEDVETCLTDCWRFEWIPGTGFEQKLGASWDADTQVACGGLTDTDWLGVHVRGHWDWSVVFQSGTKVFTDLTVMRLEPMEPGQRCRP